MRIFSSVQTGTLKKNAVLLKGHIDKLQEDLMGRDQYKFTYQLHQSHSKKHSSNGKVL